MKTKQTQSSEHAFNKLFAIAGIFLVFTGSIASIYYAYVNQRFISDAISITYYLQYFIVLAGGFATGYFLSRGSGTHYAKLFAGAVYMALTSLIYGVVEIARLAALHSLGDLPFPWGRLVFLGMPLLALIVALLIAYLAQYRKSQTTVSSAIKITAIVLFLIVQLFPLITTSAVFIASRPLWHTVINYLISPLFIAIVCYLLAGRTRSILERAFYAALISTLYMTLVAVLWDFRTDPSAAATEVFSLITLALSLVLTGVLLFFTRRAAVKI